MKFALALLAALCAATPSFAAVAFDSKSTADCDASAATISCTGTKSPTVGSGTNRALWVGVAFVSSGVGPTITATWGGTSIPFVNKEFSAANSIGTAILCLANPASGNLTLAVTTTGTVATELHVMGASFTGVNQTTPCTNYASLSNPTSTATVSITVTSATGDIAAAVYSNDQQAQGATNPNLNGTPLTAYGHDLNGPTTSMEANYIAGAATVALTDTAAGAVTDWQVSAVDIQAAGGGGGSTCGKAIPTHGAGC